MIILTSTNKAQQALAQHTRTKRLQMRLTQEGLANRSGVPLATLRKFEQRGAISLESFLKLLSVLGGLEATVTALQPQEDEFASIDEVLQNAAAKLPRRGRIK